MPERANMAKATVGGQRQHGCPLKSSGGGSNQDIFQDIRKKRRPEKSSFFNMFAGPQKISISLREIRAPKSSKTRT